MWHGVEPAQRKGAGLQPAGFSDSLHIRNCRAVALHDPLEHDPEKACPALDPGWIPVFGKACPRARPEGSCSDNNVVRYDDSTKSHLALAGHVPMEPVGCIF